MTAPRNAPRPTDEQFEKAASTESPLRVQKLYREGLRARASESAALARVRRLEEALEQLTTFVEEENAHLSTRSPKKADAAAAARAALSEET